MENLQSPPGKNVNPQTWGEPILRPAMSSDQATIRSLIYSARLNPLGLSWRGFEVLETDSGEIIGCGQIKQHRDGSQELASLYVQPAFRGRGLAARMIQRLKDKSDRSLWLTCRSSLVPFYKHFGFSETTDPQAMPDYFRRVWKVFRFFSSWFTADDSLAVMNWLGSEEHA